MIKGVTMQKQKLNNIVFILLFFFTNYEVHALTTRPKTFKKQSQNFARNEYNQFTHSLNSAVLSPSRKSRGTDGNYPPRPISKKYPQVGVYFMPFWDLDITVAGQTKTVNWFWGCLQESWLTDCLFTNNPAWGVHDGKVGRDYTGEVRPDMSHKIPQRGFYNPNSQAVIKEQIAEMKEHGIDYIIYDWFWGRHYYHDLSLYYPAAWQTTLKNTDYGLRADKRAGISESGLLRVRVPGMELHAEQLHTIVNTLDKLPIRERIDFSIMWVDDSYENWINWLKAGQVGSGTLEAKAPWYIAQNMPEERHSKKLFLQVHEKMINLWYDQYLTRDYYLKDENGRPIVYHMFADNTIAWASAYGLTLKDLIDKAHQVAAAKNLPKIKFIYVGGENGPRSQAKVQNGYGVKTHWQPNSNDQTKWFLGGTNTHFVSRDDLVKMILNQGYDGLGAYVYYSYTNPNESISINTSFDLMLENYEANWRYSRELLKQNGNKEFHTPTALGWDMTPAGGYNYDVSGKPSFPQMDIGQLPVHQYKDLLQAAKSDSKYVTLCCWNEYMEGNILEPQVGAGFSYLRAVNEVFNQSPTVNRPRPVRSNVIRPTQKPITRPTRNHGVRSRIKR